MNGACVRDFLDLGRAASGAGDELFIRLFLEVLETGKPPLKRMIFLANEIVDHHKILVDYSIRLLADIVKSGVAVQEPCHSAFINSRLQCRR
jgi:hypothetical protein